MRQRTKAQIEEVDWSVGKILATLRQLNLEKKTLVIFTSDNGGASGCVNAPLRGRKGSQFEGGMREPTIAWQPGTIPAGSKCDDILTTMDLLPTFAAISNAGLPDDRIIDGRNIDAILKGIPDATIRERTFYYYAARNLRAVRSGPWKLFNSGELYHLDKDIGEKNNVAALYPDIVERLRREFSKAAKDLGDGDRLGEKCRPVGMKKHSRTLVPRPGIQGAEGFIPTLNLPKPPAK